jgi:hypothetical protein
LLQVLAVGLYLQKLHPTPKSDQSLAQVQDHPFDTARARKRDEYPDSGPIAAFNLVVSHPA